MKIFSYALIYAALCFVVYMVYKFIRFAYVRIRATLIRRKLSKFGDTEKNSDMEKKDD